MGALTADFLAQRRIAVAGVSRRPETHGANAIYRRLKARGFEVFALNPNAETVEGDRAYPDLASIPGGVDAVVIATAPTHADDIVRECGTVGVRRVWMHAGPGQTSVSRSAVDLCRANGIAVIPGGCPLMFDPTADVAHKCMRFVLRMSGTVPRGI